MHSRINMTTEGCESGARVQFELLFPRSWHRVQGELWDPALVIILAWFSDPALVIVLPGKTSEINQ